MNSILQRNVILSGEISQLYGFCFNTPLNTFDTDGLMAPHKAFFLGMAIGNCAIGLYELAEYFKCMERARNLSSEVTKKFEAEKTIEWCRKNRGQECTELLSDAAERGMHCGLWAAGRYLIGRVALNPVIILKAAGK